MAKLKPPPGELKSFTFTPSINTSVRSEAAPRTKLVVTPPSPPERVTVMPGTRLKRSEKTTFWESSISRAVMTETLEPTLSITVGRRVTVMVTSGRSSAARAAGVRLEAAITPAARDKGSRINILRGKTHRGLPERVP